MKVQVRLFATLRQIAGWKEQAWTLAEEATVADLISTIDAEMPHLGLATRVYHVAVNEEFAAMETPLHNGDTVGIFPPVSGGAR